MVIGFFPTPSSYPNYFYYFTITGIISADSKESGHAVLIAQGKFILRIYLQVAFQDSHSVVEFSKA